MAAPHVAGVAALMLSRNPSLTPDQVAATLRATAHAFPASCPGCGAGIVDARAAVDAAVASVAPFATVSIVPSSIFKVRIGYGTVVAPASATITNGSPPFVYRWSSAWGQLSLYNAASSTVSVSAYLEPCGGVARIDDQLVLQVTDALNRVNTVYAPVTFIADPKQGEICQ
jgi:subtilisin family serine protease